MSKKISELTAATLPLSGSEIIPVVQGGVSKKITVDDLPSGGGLESYQNSAMSAPVQAYIYRDADDNIVRVYGPLRNNDVSRNQFAYADSIDKFPFDSVDCFNARLLDAKLIDLASDVKIQGSILETIVINGNSHSGLILENHIHKGEYGEDATNGAEIHIVGNNVVFEDNWVGCGTYFDSLGEGCYVGKSFFENYVDIHFHGHSNCRISVSYFKNDSEMHFNADNAILQTSSLEGGACYLAINNSVSVQHLIVGNGSSIDVNHTVIWVSFGMDITYSTLGALSNKTFIKIGTTAYELGVTAGSVTATAV